MPEIAKIPADRIPEGRRLFGLIGYPLSHSFSKKYFTAKFEREGLLNCDYELFPLNSIKELPGLLHSHPDLEGLNITIPYKRDVVQFLDDATHLPPGLGACNCIKIRDSKRSGYNTDVIGFEKSFTPLLKPYHRKALVLGNGGVTAAVLFVLSKLGFTYEVVSRQLHDEATLTYEAINAGHVNDCLVIINTTPLGMYPQTDACPAIPYSLLTPRHLLYDMVYNPAETLFLQKGKQQGATIKNGEEMLILQAEESWRIWNDN